MPDDTEPTPYGSWEYNFRSRMPALREAKEMTQTDLARQLRDVFGLPFHQQTIDRIESGKRPVRLNEAHLIAQALGADVEAMTEDEGSEESVAMHLRIALRRFEDRAFSVSEVLDETVPVLQQDADVLTVAWEDYKEARGRLNLSVDEDLAADVGRFLRRYNRAMEGWTLLQEIGDL